jgi:hypothetical protein
MTGKLGSGHYHPPSDLSCCELVLPAFSVLRDKWEGQPQAVHRELGRECPPHSITKEWEELGNFQRRKRVALQVSLGRTHRGDA